MRERHLLSGLKWVGATVPALAAAWLVASGAVVDLSDTGSLAVIAVCVAAVAAVAVVYRRLMPRVPRESRAQRRRDTRAYREIERSLDRMRVSRSYLAAGYVGFVNTGTRWRPRLLRFVIDEDAVPQGDAVGELPVETLSLSPMPPKVFRVVDMAPLRLDEDGGLVLDQELFERTTPVAKGRLERLEAARMAISTGSGWLTSDELGGLVEQLKDAVPVEPTS